MQTKKKFPLEKGFTLTEIMVGLLIGMITVMVILNTVASSESVRRNVSSSSDSTTTGSLASQILQRELLNAGFGSTVDTELFTICGANGISAFNINRAPSGISLATNEFQPLRIIPWDDLASPYPAPDTDTDIIQVTASGTSSFLGKGVDVSGQPASSNEFTITSSSSRAGLRMGDLMVAVPCTATPSTTTPCTADGAKVCVVTQITDLPYGVGALNECNVASAAPDTDRTIRHDTGGNFLNSYERNTDGTCVSTPAVWNKAGDPNLGVDYAGAKLYSMGPPDRLVMRAYAIRAGNLTSCDLLHQNCFSNDPTVIAQAWQIIAENIVSLRAQYGYDASANSNVEAAEWVRVLPGSPVWTQLKAIRFALVARGSQRERDVVSSDCTPDWSANTNANVGCTGTAQDGEIFLQSAPDGANWARYRYKLYQTTTPLRNLYWGDNLS